MNPLTNNPKNELDKTLKMKVMKIRAPKMKGGTYYSDFDVSVAPYRVRRSLKTSNKAEAERANRLMFQTANGMAAVFPSEDGVECPMPLGDAILRYEHHDYRTLPRLADFEAYIGADTFLHNIKPRHICDWAESVQRRRGMKYSSLGTWRSTLSTFFEMQIRKDRCLRNPTVSKNSWPEGSREERDNELRRLKSIKATTNEEREALFELVDKEPQLAMAFRLAYLCGAERCAIVGMKHSDVDFSANTIHVPGTKSVQRNRVVTLVPKLAEFLRSRGVGEGSKDQYLVHDYNSSLIPCTAAALSLRVWRFNRKHGVPLKLHEGRHDLGSRAHKSGCDAFTCGKLLGHSDQGQVAAKYYIRTSPTDYAAKMEEALR